MLQTKLNTFVKRHDCLVCIDSDGTAMDVMNIKHKKCFGPCLVKEWGLESHEKEVLSIWNDINLYRETRGKNRFITLYLTLKEVDEKIRKIEGLASLKNWLDRTTQLSNQSLFEEIEENPQPILKKALSWSQAVNQHTVLLTYDDKRPFDGVKEFLERAYKQADIAIVSSAGYKLIKEEWQYHGLLQYVSTIATQEDGSKAECLKKLVDKGYEKNHVLMIGDAPSDLHSAKESGVLFCPIVPDDEANSWELLRNEYFPDLLAGRYADKEQESVERLYKFFKKSED